MTYDEALSFWYGRINYEVRSAQPGDLKLERMRALLRLLGDPHDRVRLVHVTGTKGKGSTCAMLASVLREAGYRVGLFTSPHLVHVEERIQINGVPISRDELAARMEEVAAAVKHLEGRGPQITFFEIGTALGFLHFWCRRCDIAVIEVGLGGRFDSTNVCHPLASVITNVGLDHTAQLGHTMEDIAFQKAGIIKRGVPVISGVMHEGSRAVIEQVARTMHTPLWESQPFEPEARRLRLGLLGEHQIANAAVVLASVA
jgi:dihydrofolate synthase/folylpolyglutamate synthase